MPGKRRYDDPSLVREPMTVADGDPSVLAMLSKMRRSAFQGRQLGQAFEVWKRMIEGPSLVCLGYAASLSSAGMWPLVTWLMERGYIDVLASTSANITEDLLEQLDGTRVYRVDADDVDDADLWTAGYYRFYDHIVSKEKYDQLETRVTSAFINELAERWRKPTIPTVRFLHEFGLWLEGRGFTRSILATAARCQVPVFCCGLPDGPLGEGYDKAAKADQAPVVDFFRDYRIATDIMDGAMTSGRGTSVVFLGGGVPKDFLQITATSVSSRHGNEDPRPHVAAIQITTDNTIYGGLGGAALATECISWGKEAKGGDNVMCFADVTIALPLICQGLAEHFGPAHRRLHPKPLNLSEVY
ncbi:MAG: deoxyhypusine synthase family protein [Candidatus Rokubacteria bacterium]|nr:deoxyhypusine synthase family protein [Candidatus Rokubacteria bacterium]